MERRNHILNNILLVVLTAGMSLNAMAAPKQMGTRVEARSVDREAQKAERKAYHQWLASERVASARGNGLVVQAGKNELNNEGNPTKSRTI